MDLLPFLCCPLSRQPLRQASAEEIARLAAQPPAETWLVAENGSCAYPVREGIPQLVPEEAVRLAGGSEPDQTR